VLILTTSLLWSLRASWVRALGTELRRVQYVSVALGVVVLLLASGMSAQSPPPYPSAVTDRLIHPKTPMLPPPINEPFTDPDFGSTIVRVTDETSDFLRPGAYLRTEASGTSNMWSADTSKFYVLGEGGSTLVYGFTPSTMSITSLPCPGTSGSTASRIACSYRHRHRPRRQGCSWWESPREEQPLGPRLVH
jgi:hypothetical protein